MNIEIISGSPRSNSVTHRVALYLHRHLAQQTIHSVGLINVRDYPLPYLEEVISSVDTAPPAFAPLAARMFAAHAFILVSPEYNGSYTAALKNLLDHFPRQQHKAFGIVATSTGALGGIRATQQMQLLVNGLFGIASPFLLPVPFMDKKFDAEGQLTDAAYQDKIDTFTREFLWLAVRLAHEGLPVE